MPISVVCTGCQKKLKAPDSAAGKRTKCPACQSVIEIPSAGGSTGKDSWTVKIASGDDFGPVTKAELDQWLKEGRLDDQCQVLQEGAPQWQWASDLYPELAAAANQPEQGAAVDPFGQAAGVQSGMQPFGQTAQAAGFPASSFPAQNFAAQKPSFQTNPAAGNPYAASSVTSRAQASGDAAAGIITIAVFNFVLSAMNLFCGVVSAVMALGGAALFSSAGRSAGSSELGNVAGGIWFVVFIVVAILYLVFGVMLLIGGVGLLKRENWGRIVTLICAGLAGVLAIFQIIGVVGSVNVAGTIWNVLFFIILAGYCVAAFIVLLSGGANRAFSKKRR